jgi:hypothetical protein
LKKKGQAFFEIFYHQNGFDAILKVLSEIKKFSGALIKNFKGPFLLIVNY